MLDISYITLPAVNSPFDTKAQVQLQALNISSPILVSNSKDLFKLLELFISTRNQNHFLISHIQTMGDYEDAVSYLTEADY